QTTDYINTLNEKDFIEAFINKNNVFNILKIFIKNNLKVKFNDDFYNAYNVYIIGISTDIYDTPDYEFWDEIIDKLNLTKLKSIYTSLRDYLATTKLNLDNKKIDFLEKGLLN